MTCEFRCQSQVHLALILQYTLLKTINLNSGLDPLESKNTTKDNVKNYYKVPIISTPATTTRMKATIRAATKTAAAAVAAGEAGTERFLFLFPSPDLLWTRLDIDSMHDSDLIKVERVRHN